MLSRLRENNSGLHEHVMKNLLTAVVSKQEIKGYRIIETVKEQGGVGMVGRERRTQGVRYKKKKVTKNRQALIMRSSLSHTHTHTQKEKQNKITKERTNK